MKEKNSGGCEWPLVSKPCDHLPSQTLDLEQYWTQDCFFFLIIYYSFFPDSYINNPLFSWFYNIFSLNNTKFILFGFQHLAQNLMMKRSQSHQNHLNTLRNRLLAYPSTQHVTRIPLASLNVNAFLFIYNYYSSPFFSYLLFVGFNLQC